MDIIHGFFPRILSMDIIHRYYPWIISMDILHGYYPWIGQKYCMLPLFWHERASYKSCEAIDFIQSIYIPLPTI